MGNLNWHYVLFNWNVMNEWNDSRGMRAIEILVDRCVCVVYCNTFMFCDDLMALSSKTCQKSQVKGYAQSSGFYFDLSHDIYRLAVDCIRAKCVHLICIYSTCFQLFSVRCEKQHRISNTLITGRTQQHSSKVIAVSD